MNKVANKIIFITFLNDFSGSPNVLSIVAKQFIEKGYSVKIITNKSKGFLSDIIGAKYSYVTYKWGKNFFKVLSYFIIAQIQLFFKVLGNPKKNTIYYINTITPIGAAWACKLTGRKMVYHVHENMCQNKPLYGLYRFTYKHCNDRTIFVSHYLEKTAINLHKGKVIYNSLDNIFLNIAKEYLSQNVPERRTILMVASLRRFKGVYEFVELAKQLPQYEFEMVLSANQDQVANFKAITQAPTNITIHPTKKNLHPYYQRAKLLLSLSHPQGWIETFGLTILEAMVYGIPAIVPNIGGPVELVKNGINGYNVDPTENKIVIEKIKLLMQDENLYHKFSQKAYELSKSFGLTQMITEIEDFINYK